MSSKTTLPSLTFPLLACALLAGAVAMPVAAAASFALPEDAAAMTSCAPGPTYKTCVYAATVLCLTITYLEGPGHCPY